MSDNKPICGILAGEPEIIGERCADGATCHHRCAAGCWRRTSCAPLSGSGLRFDWSPVEPSLSGLRDAAGDRFEVPVAWLSGPAEEDPVLAGQHPVGEMISNDGDIYWTDRHPPMGTKLYAATVAQPVSSALADVVAERRRQIAVEGWTPEHDDEHSNGEMALAAACYARHAIVPPALSDVPATWPWGASWWKPGDPRRMLVKAAALILAEIERLDRADSADSLEDGCRGIAGLDHRFTPGPFSGARYCSKCGVAEDPDAARAAMRTYLGLDSEDA